MDALAEFKLSSACCSLTLAYLLAKNVDVLTGYTEIYCWINF